MTPPIAGPEGCESTALLRLFFCMSHLNNFYFDSCNDSIAHFFCIVFKWYNKTVTQFVITRVHLLYLFLRCSGSFGMCDTHKLNAAVVGEQLLDPDTPVVSGHQSTVGHMGLTQEADPGVGGFKRVEGPFSDQDV